MQPPEEMPRTKRRRTNRGRILIVLAVVGLLVLITSLRGLAGFYTDFLWFDSLGFGSVWRSVLWARIGLGLLFTAIFFVLLWTNLYVADRLAPKVRPPGPEEDLVRRYHQLIGRRAGLIRVVIALVFSVIAGAGVSSQWQDWLFFTNRVDFGIEDPQFHRDIGFYIFQLPFLTFVVTWAFAAVLIVFVVTAAEHYLNGGIRLQTRQRRVTPQVKAHLSLLLGLLALAKAVGYYLDQFELTLSSRGFVDGASYTDVKAQLPAIQLLMIISVFSFCLLIFNIWRRGFTYPIIAVGLWALVATLAGTLYPALVQRFQVEPSESVREQPYIDRNVEMTRIAMGLDDLIAQQFNYTPELDAADILKNIETVRNVRLLDPAIMQNTFQQTQGVRSFYEFEDIDVDRYELDGRTTQVVLAARELNQNDLPNKSWESEHVAFTHGYGLAAAPANAVDADGQPAYVVSEIPLSSTPGATGLIPERPGLYFGEGLSGYAIVGAERDEVDFQQSDDTTQNTRYDGSDGVGVGGFIRRSAFALRFAEPNIFISGEVRGDSRILYIRDVAERARTLAPFLEYDSDPYPAVVGDQVVWILDAYTTSDRFPYAQRVDPNAATVGSDLRSSFNYVRNSVKVTVGAYDGRVTFYIIDEDDPLARSYRKQFPDLFSEEEPSAELKAHFRYPEDLFRIQTDMWGRYRIDASEFYDAAGEWDVAQNPPNEVGTTDLEEVRDAQGNLLSRNEVRIDPQYLLMRLPGQADESFLLFRPFVPASDSDSRRNLTGFMVAHSDPERYGELEVFEIRSDSTVEGPALFANNIQREPDISQPISLLDGDGSEVLLGNLLLIPIEDSLLYVQPLYVQTQGTAAPVPELQRVIVGVGDIAVMAPTFEEALELAIPGLDIDLGGPRGKMSDDEPVDDESVDDEPAGSGDGSPNDPGDDAGLIELIEAARTAFDEADIALRSGDLAGYQESLREAEGYIRRAENEFPAAADPSPSSTPSTSTSEAAAA